MGSLRLPIVWGYCRKTASATAAEEDRMDLLWRIQCDFIASLAQGCSPVATMFGYTCRDFRIGVVVVLDLGALTKCYQGGVEWGDDAQPEPEDKVWTSRFWFQTVVTLDNTNSLVHILRILVISFDAGRSQALHRVGLFALVTPSGFACAGSLPTAPAEAQQCETRASGQHWYDIMWRWLT